jgi:YesN/AraC family two-component response regulator
MFKIGLTAPGCGVIRVLVVDDHEIVREGLKRIISQAPDIAVTGEAIDGSEALEAVSESY